MRKGRPRVLAAEATYERHQKEGATTESPVDGQDQPKIYTIRDHTLEVLMHPDVLELHAVKVVHTPQGDERQLHLKVRVRCGQEWSGYDGVDVRERPVPRPSVHFSEGG